MKQVKPCHLPGVFTPRQSRLKPWKDLRSWETVDPGGQRPTCVSAKEVIARMRRLAQPN